MGAQWCNHEKVSGTAAAWLVCREYCGWVGVCRSCLVELGLAVPQGVPWAVCSRHWVGVKSGKSRCVDGYVVAVEEVFVDDEEDEMYEEAGGMLAEE